jgi:hypothetical protein
MDAKWFQVRGKKPQITVVSVNTHAVTTVRPEENNAKRSCLF